MSEQELLREISSDLEHIGFKSEIERNIVGILCVKLGLAAPSAYVLACQEAGQGFAKSYGRVPTLEDFSNPTGLGANEYLKGAVFMWLRILNNEVDHD